MIDPIEFGKQMGAIVRDSCAPLMKRIEELEARALERGEKGEAGEPGKDADPIEAAEVVAELLLGDEIKTLVDLHVAEAVAKYFETNPVLNGKDGSNGAQGERGEKGDIGESGLDGKDGVGLADTLLNQKGELVLTMTDGRIRELGVVIGKDGATGKDGADLSDVSFDYDGHRTFTIKAKGGEVVKTYVLPIPLDAGYWRDGTSEAQKGDILTHDGNAWIALSDTKSKPGHDTKTDWRLFARKGRDGNDGKNGRDLGPAPAVKLNGNG